MLSGCLPTVRVPVVAERYRIEVALTPQTHRLSARCAIDLVMKEPAPLEEEDRRPVEVAFRLHPALRVRRVETAGVEAKRSLLPFRRVVRQ
ncbi:MAG: hypothetical protein D6788_09590, partial [Planctomycetota bacterium]